MDLPFSPKDMADYEKAARRAAADASADVDVQQWAAAFAIEQLVELYDTVSPKKHKAWIRVVARAEARKQGKKLHREDPMGRAGSLLPKDADRRNDKAELEKGKKIDDFMAQHVMGLRPGGESVSSLVANTLLFEEAWELLDSRAQDLLVDKYVHHKPTKKIAQERGLAPGYVDNLLTRARQAARPLFEEIYDDLNS